MFDIGINHFLVLSSALLVLGVYGVCTRRNAIALLMSVELILNSAAINFVAFNHFLGKGLSGQVFGIFIVAVAAAETAVAIGIIVRFYRLRGSIDLEQAATLHG